MSKFVAWIGGPEFIVGNGCWLSDTSCPAFLIGKPGYCKGKTDCPIMAIEVDE